jgi:hypothetical protein
MYLLVIIFLALVLIALSRYRLIGYKPYIPLATLMIINISFIWNTIDSGIYADAHHLSGAQVGWFGLWGGVILLLSLLLTAVNSVYIIYSARIIQRHQTAKKITR